MKNPFLFLFSAILLILASCSRPEASFEDVNCSATAEMHRISRPGLYLPFDSLLLSDDSCRYRLNRYYYSVYPGLKGLSKATMTALHSVDFSQAVLSSAYRLGMLSSGDSLAFVNDSLSAPNISFYLYSLPNNHYALVRPYRGAFSLLAYIVGNDSSSTDLITNYTSYAYTVADVADSVALDNSENKYDRLHRKIAMVHGLGKEDLMTFTQYTELMWNQFRKFEDVIYSGNPDTEYFDGVVTCDISNQTFNWSQVASPFTDYLSNNSIVGSTVLCIAKLLAYECSTIQIGDVIFTPNGTPSLSTASGIGLLFSKIHQETNTTPSLFYPVTTNYHGLKCLSDLGFTLTTTPVSTPETDKAAVIADAIERNHPVIAINHNRWYLIEGIKRSRKGGNIETRYTISQNAAIGEVSIDMVLDLKKFMLITYEVDNDLHSN